MAKPIKEKPVVTNVTLDKLPLETEDIAKIEQVVAPVKVAGTLSVGTAVIILSSSFNWLKGQQGHIVDVVEDKYIVNVNEAKYLFTADCFKTA